MNSVCWLFKKSGFLIILGTLFLFSGAELLAEDSGNKTSQKARAGENCQIVLLVGDVQVATITAELLSTLENVVLKVPGVRKKQEGPRLKALLSALKINDFKQITFMGMAKGRIATAEYRISKEQLHDDIILAYSKRGTVKLVVPELSFDDWVVDIERVVVE